MKNLPKSIQIRLSNNSVNEEKFKEAAGPHNAALKENEHNYTLKYTPNHNRHENSKANPRTEAHHETELKHNGCQKRGQNTRTRKITWFNPPFSMNVATNIGKNFFSLLNECFPKTSELKKIISKNTIKLSYSCMANMKQKIDNHDRKIMSNRTEREEVTRTCNCRGKTLCPLKGKYLQEGVVYKAIVTQTETMKQDIYIGMTENPYKTRYNLRNSSFRLPHKSSKTTLSEHLWTLKDAGVIHKREWTILEKAKPCSPAARKCDLCLAEKYYILEKSRLLSKRSEIFGTCPHRRKHFLQNSDRSNEENSA